MARQVILENANLANINTFRSKGHGYKHYRSQSDNNIRFCPVSEAVLVHGILKKYQTDLQRISKIIHNKAAHAANLPPLQIQHNRSRGNNNSVNTGKGNAKKTLSSISKKSCIIAEVVQSQVKVNQKKPSHLNRSIEHTSTREILLSEKCSAHFTCKDGRNNNQKQSETPFPQIACASQHMESCFSNSRQIKQQIVWKSNHLSLPPAHLRTRSKSPPARRVFEQNNKQSSPARSQGVLKQRVYCKTVSANGRPPVQTKATKGNQCNKTYCLSAWGKAGKDIVQYSCSKDDLAILKNAVYHSSRHSSLKCNCCQPEIATEEQNQARPLENLRNEQASHIENILNKEDSSIRNILNKQTSHVRKNQASTMLNVCSTTQLPMHNAEDIISKSQITVDSNVCSQDETECRTKLCEEYTSTDSSNSFQTRSIWCENSANDSKRTSVDYRWETTTQEDVQSNASIQDYLLDEYRQRVSSNEINRRPSSRHHRVRNYKSSLVKPDEHTRTRLESAVILSELSMGSYYSTGLNLLWHQLGHIPTDSRDHFLSGKAKTETQVTQDTLKQPHLGNNRAYSPTPYLAQRRSSRDVYKNLRLVRSISSPDLSACEEERAQQYLVLSRVIQTLYSKRKTYNNQNNFCGDLVGVSPCTIEMSSAKIRKQMRKILCNSKERDAALKPFKATPYYIWKWRLFVLIMSALLAFWTFLAYMATTASFQ